jgi:MFS family permease
MGFLALFKLHESFTPEPQVQSLTLGETFRKLPSLQLITGLFITTLVMQFAVMAIQPIITVYITQIASSSDHIALIAGLVFSCTGFASMLTSSRIGKLADSIGSQKVLLVSLILAGLSSIPQGLVQTPFELGVLRFIFGIALAGLLPSVNNLIRHHTPSICLGRIYGFNQSAQYLGMFAGGVLGGQIAAAMGIANLFFITAVLLLVNAVWCRIMVYSAAEQSDM